MKFREAFGIEKGDVVALIGAGGKTSLMVGIGYELAESGWRVLATTTARMPEEQLNLVPLALPVSISAASTLPPKCTAGKRTPGARSTAHRARRAARTSP